MDSTVIIVGHAVNDVIDFYQMDSIGGFYGNTLLQGHDACSAFCPFYV